jgi:glycosyltransferase involved in cell wall biosynthesis
VSFARSGSGVSKTAIRVPSSEMLSKDFDLGRSRHRLAFIVSHPIQYYVPLYQRLARRDDLSIKVFFTWHDGSVAKQDRGFGIPIVWDIPLNQGYDSELVENISADPGTHHFWGLRNPSLVDRVLAWRPTVTHITGWAWRSHLHAIRSLAKAGRPTLFRGDSHLLNESPSGPRWWLKQAVLKRIYSWPTAFLVTGQANYEYYRTFGVRPERLRICPHSVDCERFSGSIHEGEAQRWRHELNIKDDQTAFLFAGKFDRNKEPIGFMKAILGLQDPNVVGILVGDGPLQAEINLLAESKPQAFRILPFQNQSRMPVVYRLADAFVMPSHSETWGLAVNEALACGRPVIVSNGVGCAPDVVDSTCGQLYPAGDQWRLTDALRSWSQDKGHLQHMRKAAASRACLFDLPRTEASLMDAVESVSHQLITAS